MWGKKTCFGSCVKPWWHQYNHIVFIYKDITSNDILSPGHILLGIVSMLRSTLLKTCIVG